MHKAAWLCLAMVLAGCGLAEHLPERTPDPQNIPISFRAPTADGHAIRRVVVIPFQDQSSGEAREMIQEVFVQELQKRHQVEVVGLGRTSLTELEEEEFFTSGTVRQATILRMLKLHRADAVVYGAITNWRPYPPQKLAIRITMVSSGAGDTIWAAHGVFDTNDARVQADLHNYHDVMLASSDNLEEWRRLLNTPRGFATYCSARLVETF